MLDIDFQVEVSGSASIGYFEPAIGDIIWRPIRDVSNDDGLKFTYKGSSKEVMKETSKGDYLFKTIFKEPQWGLYKKTRQEPYRGFYQALPHNSDTGFVCFIDGDTEIDPLWTFARIISMTRNQNSAFVELYSAPIRVAIETRLGRLRHEDRIPKKVLGGKEPINDLMGADGALVEQSSNYRFFYNYEKDRVTVERKLFEGDDWSLIDIY